MTCQSKALTALAARSDLQAFGSNAVLLYALQLRWGIPDIEGVAAVALTDSSNDKKSDLAYVDRDNGRVVVGQGYTSVKTNLEAAPANKASDLNTAVAWLLSGDLDGLPDVLGSPCANAISSPAGGSSHVPGVRSTKSSAPAMLDRSTLLAHGCDLFECLLGAAYLCR